MSLRRKTRGRKKNGRLVESGLAAGIEVDLLEWSETVVIEAHVVRSILVLVGEGLQGVKGKVNPLAT